MRRSMHSALEIANGPRADARALSEFILCQSSGDAKALEQLG
jgi:hypothetical protein